MTYLNGIMSLERLSMSVGSLSKLVLGVVLALRDRSRNRDGGGGGVRYWRRCGDGNWGGCRGGVSNWGGCSVRHWCGSGVCHGCGVGGEGGIAEAPGGERHRCRGGVRQWGGDCYATGFGRADREKARESNLLTKFLIKLGI